MASHDIEDLKVVSAIFALKIITCDPHLIKCSPLAVIVDNTRRDLARKLKGSLFIDTKKKRHKPRSQKL